MNFVYYSKESYVATVIGHIRYVWGDIDIRDYLSEDAIQDAKDIVIAANGGNIRVLRHDSISSKRKYQVITEFTMKKDLKSKYLLICPTKMKWEFDELTSEGSFEVGEKYIDIVDDNINEMEILDLASNLSYMYGIRFVPHTIEYGKVYRISLSNSTFNIDNVWKDVENNLSTIKKLYKLSNIFIDSVKKKNKLNDMQVSYNDLDWK